MAEPRALNTLFTSIEPIYRPRQTPGPITLGDCSRCVDPVVPSEDVLHRQEQIATHWPAYWQAVIHTVKEDVATFNAQFPADLSKHLYVETPSAGHELTVRRPSEPPNRAVRLIRAAVLEGCIRLTLIEITFNPPGGHDLSTEHLVFEVANGGGVGVMIDGVVSDHLLTARAILKPLFRG